MGVYKDDKGVNRWLKKWPASVLRKLHDSNGQDIKTQERATSLLINKAKQAYGLHDVGRC
jgi:hypothetical protein